MEMFFWCESGEDGMRVTAMTRDEMEKALTRLAKDEADVRPEYRTTFLDKMPNSDKGYWMGCPDHSVVIVKGEIVVPKAEKVVEKYSI